MKVLVASRGVLPIGPDSGGAEFVALKLAVTMARAGHEVIFVSDTAPGYDTKAEPRLRFVSLRSPLQRQIMRLRGGFFRWLIQHLVGNVSVARKVREVLRDESDIDLIHAHGNLSAILITRFARVAVVYTEHDATPWSCRYRTWHERTIRKILYRALNVTAFRRATHVATIFDGLRLEIIDRWGVPERRVTTIGNGTDVDVFNPDRPETSLVRDQLGFDHYCLFVGKLTPRKAPDILIRAVADTDDVKCVFVGDGPMRRSLESLAKKLGVDGRVGFLGAVAPEQLGRIYADADVLALPSVSEGAPLVVLEAMACGTPVVGTRISGLPNVVRDWETGFLVKPNDVGQLAMAIRFLTGESSLRQRMGETARNLVQRDFVWPKVADQYVGLYEQLRIGSASATPRVDTPDVPVATLAGQ